MKPTTFKLPTKIQWQTDLSKTWQELFYPSVVKKLNKEFFKYPQYFELKELEVDQDILLNVFAPVYDAQIAARPDYHLDRDQQFKTILSHIKSRQPYRLYGLFEKGQNIFAGGILFSVKGDHIAITFRAFDHKVTQKGHSRISIDYWVEAQFLDFVTKYQKPFLTHGKDQHPRIGKIGVSLYKLKVGSKPHVVPSLDTLMKTYQQDELIALNQPVFFFDSPDPHGAFKKAFLFYKESDVDMSFIHEIEVVLNWANIPLTIHKS